MSFAKFTYSSTWVPSKSPPLRPGMRSPSLSNDQRNWNNLYRATRPRSSSPNSSSSQYMKVSMVLFPHSSYVLAFQVRCDPFSMHTTTSPHPSGKVICRDYVGTSINIVRERVCEACQRAKVACFTWTKPSTFQEPHVRLDHVHINIRIVWGNQYYTSRPSTALHNS